MDPTQLTVAARRDAVLQARALSLVHRLLGGAGRASLVAYHLAPGQETPALSHCLTRAGELVVAAPVDDDVTVTLWGSHTPLRVRMDIVKEAPEWDARITACTIHMLGSLAWLDDKQKADYLEFEGIHPRVAELASSPAWRLGVVQAERVLLHDSHGVTPFEFEEIADLHLERTTRGEAAFPAVDQEFEARDVVARVWQSEAKGLLRAADMGWSAAIPMSVGNAGNCKRFNGSVFVVDVDSAGVTLMEVDAGMTAVTMLAFDSPARNNAELAQQLRHLRDTAWI